jgi:hypothetical protein
MDPVAVVQCDNVTKGFHGRSGSSWRITHFAKYKPANISFK